MTVDPPAEWRLDVDRTYRPAGAESDRRYATYEHESGDVRLRLAPTSLDDDDEPPGYGIRVRTYPGLDCAETVAIRRLLTFSRCLDVANRFMTLFSATYDGPTALEDALTYAVERTRPSDAHDAPVTDGSTSANDDGVPGG